MTAINYTSSWSVYPYSEVCDYTIQIILVCMFFLGKYFSGFPLPSKGFTVYHLYCIWIILSNFRNLFFLSKVFSKRNLNNFKPVYLNRVNSLPSSFALHWIAPRAPIKRQFTLDSSYLFRQCHKRLISRRCHANTQRFTINIPLD